MTKYFIFTLVGLIAIMGCTSTNPKVSQRLFPQQNSKNINPDTHLKLIFSETPKLGSRGMIRIFDAEDNTLVDSLDLSIPAGPTEPNREKAPYIASPYEYISDNYTNANTKAGTPSGGALPTPDNFQLSIIGRFTDGFHFYPVIIHDSVATIYPHNNLLAYGKTYYVEVDSSVFSLGQDNFGGIYGKNSWSFSTKSNPPTKDKKKLIVSADGSGDFNTVQGAIDFIPDYQKDRRTIFIKNGRYEEIVYFRNKWNVTFLGESRDSVWVGYPNNEIFNPHPVNISTNEWPGTFPSRRVAFAADNCKGIHLANMTIESANPKPAQAEGLLINGSENIVYNVTILGSGDALQSNGSAYYENVFLKGLGDNVLGRGPAFFKNCELISFSGPHMWIRNTKKNHGNVFVNCIFRMDGNRETVIARTSDNKGGGYPYCEAVLLNCKLHGIRPEGWGVQGNATSHIHYWEFNSTNLMDGTPVDVSQRHSISRQLKMKDDKEIIKNYSNPAFVLGGWVPDLKAYRKK